MNRKRKNRRIKIIRAQKLLERKIYKILKEELAGLEWMESRQIAKTSEDARIAIKLIDEIYKNAEIIFNFLLSDEKDSEKAERAEQVVNANYEELSDLWNKGGLRNPYEWGIFEVFQYGPSVKQKGIESRDSLEENKRMFLAGLDIFITNLEADLDL